ncbi:MAG: outer membrane protein assembly factor BamA [Pseudomonadota bacterium]
MLWFGRYRRSTVWVVAILSLALVWALPAVPQTVTFSSIEVRGNERVEDATVLSFAGITPGQPITAGQLNSAYQRILASNLFESVEIDTRGGRLVIDVDEFPTINEISIEGNRRINDEVLLELVRSQPRRVYSPTQAEADARTLTEAYREAGRLAATVQPKIIARSQNRVDLVFEVLEGAVVEIERISFVGNRSYSDRRLRQVLATKQAGLFRQVIQRDTFLEDRLQFDQQLLEDFYMSRGFIDFEVVSVTSEFSRERNGFFITFNLREGQRYEIGNIRVQSDLPGVDPQRFRDILRMRTGQTYSPNLIENNVARLERKAIQDRLDFVRVVPQIERDDQNRRLNVTFVMERGPRVFVERIDIEGNATTLDRVIRQQFRVVEGDPFNPREIQQAAARIRALGYFSQSSVDTREGTTPDRVIVDVDVEEQPTGSLSFGVNFSFGDGVGLAFGLTERNFLGRGQILAFQLGAGADNADTSLTFTDPYLFGRDLVGSASIYYRTTNQFAQDFDTQQIGFEPGLNFPLSENGRLGLRYRISQDEISDVTQFSSAILQEEEGTKLTSAVGYTYSWDNRRTGLNPNAGIAFEFSQDFAGVGGDVEFIRTQASVTGETRLFREEVGLTVTLAGGDLTSLGDTDSRILDRYTAGGRVRGFDRNGLGPRDLAALNEDALGGNRFVAFSVEADFPLGLPEEYGIRGGVFFDAGSVWDLDNNIGTNGVPVDDSFILRSVIGASIFWTTPIGPLRFDFTAPLQSEPYDDTRNFDVTINSRF